MNKGKEVPEMITEIIQKRQLICYGHVKRMPENRLSRLPMELAPLEQERRRRPRKPWGGDIKKSMSKLDIINKQSQSREKCRKFLDAINHLTDRDRLDIATCSPFLVTSLSK